MITRRRLLENVSAGAALAAMGAVDDLLCLGDSISQHRFSNEVVGLLKSLDARMILGNHEEMFLSEAGALARQQEQLHNLSIIIITDGLPHLGEFTIP